MNGPIYTPFGLGSRCDTHRRDNIWPYGQLLDLDLDLDDVCDSPSNRGTTTSTFVRSPNLGSMLLLDTGIRDDDDENEKVFTC